MLTNISNTGGVVIQILRLPPSGTGQGHARIAQSLRLPSNIKQAARLAVANLTPPASPTSGQGYTQLVVAVGGGDKSISLFKVDLQVEAGVSLVTKVKPFRTFKDDHAGAIAVTDLAFSNFTPPSTPITASTPPQYLKLASTGSHTVVVHTLPLFPVPLSVARGQSKTPRYVVALPSKAAKALMTSITSIIATCLLAIIIQAVLEVRGTAKPRLNATKYLPTLMQEALGKPYVFPPNYGHNHHLGIPSTLPEIYSSMEKEGSSVVVVQDTPHGIAEVKVQEQAESTGKTWEELSAEHKEGWKKKLSEAGHWAEGMGETILKGVVFGELGGIVGQAAAAAVAG